MSIETRQCRPYPSPCKLCGHVFGPKEKFRVEETKVSWFRGDDIVEFFCWPKCIPPVITEPEPGAETAR